MDNDSNDGFINYLNPLPVPIDFEHDFKSLNVEIHRDRLISDLTKKIVTNLIHSPIDSYHGISKQTEDRMGKQMKLNLDRVHVLRQNYGKDVGMVDDRTVLRYTYGYKPNPTVVTADPNKFVTKPFCHNMGCISKLLHDQLVENITKYNLTDLKLNREFNSCTVLIYDKGSTMGWHTDTKYKLNGEYREINYQVKDTPVIIVPFGDERTLKFRRQYRGRSTKGKMGICWLVDTTWNKIMVMKNGTMTIINSIDEIPHEYRDLVTGILMKVRYQHGGVKYTGDKISGALVFRVVDEAYTYNVFDNVMKTDIQPTKQYDAFACKKIRMTEIERQRMYNDHDDDAYQCHLISKLKMIN